MGPRTPAGKAVVALNAVRHGLLSRESLVNGESEADLVDFGKRLRSQLVPVGELEGAPKSAETLTRRNRTAGSRSVQFD